MKLALLLQISGMLHLSIGEYRLNCSVPTYISHEILRWLSFVMFWIHIKLKFSRKPMSMQKTMWRMRTAFSARFCRVCWFTSPYWRWSFSRLRPWGVFAVVLESEALRHVNSRKQWAILSGEIVACRSTAPDWIQKSRRGPLLRDLTTF